MAHQSSPLFSGAPRSRRDALRAGAGLGALGVVGSLAAACGSGKGAGDTGSSAAGGASSSGGGGAGVSLSQWYHAYGEQGTEQAAKRFAAAYKKAPVGVQWIPGDYTTRLASGLVSSKGPDVFEDQLTASMVQAHQVVALDDVIGSAKSDFHAADLALGTFEGKLYGIPMIEDMQMLYYRKSLLSKAGVKPPTTWDDLMSATKELSSSKIKGLYAGQKQGVDVFGGPALWSVGLTYVTPGHTCGFDDPGAATALANLRKLAKTDGFLQTASTDWSDPSVLLNEQAAMQWTGLWNMPQFLAKFKDDVGVLPFPAMSSRGKPSVPIGDYLAMVNAKSKNIEAAKAFVKWLWIDHTAYQLEWAQSYGYHLPVRDAVTTKATKLKTGTPAAAVALSKRYAHAASPPDWTATMSTAYADALSNVIISGKDPAAALKGVVSTVTGELKKIYG